LEKDKPLSGTRLTARALIILGRGREAGWAALQLLQLKGGRPMPTIAAPALTADRIDYWIPPHIIQYCYGTHPSQSKFIPRGGRRVGMLAIGRCLKDQYDSLATPAPPASHCTRQETRRTGIAARHATGRPTHPKCISHPRQTVQYLAGAQKHCCHQISFLRAVLAILTLTLCPCS
jgi:hypothetical protein